MGRAAALVLAALGLGEIACGGVAPDAEAPSATTDDACPAMRDAPRPLPGMRPEHEQLAYWMPLLAAQTGDVDAPILDDAGLRALDTRIAGTEDQFDLFAPYDEARARSRLEERFGQIRERIGAGQLFAPSGAPLDAADAAALETASLRASTPTFHVTLAPVHLRCTPRATPYFTSATDRRFDRNQCSHVRAQELVQRLGSVGDDVLVRTRYTFGFIRDADRVLSPALTETDAREAATSPRARIEAPITAAGVTVPEGTLVVIDPARPGYAIVHAPTRRSVPLPAHVVRPRLTRRAVLEEAFRRLGTPYGWGGEGDGLDCSSFVMETLAVFGLHVPRHSADQAENGSLTIDVTEADDDAARVALLDEANRAGLVLVHFPGHIMLYLGRDAQGRPTAIHAFAEYVEPCVTPAADGRRETLRRAPGVSVTHLEIGRGTSRGAFLERMTKITVFGRSTPALTRSRASSAEEAPAPPVHARACGLEDEASIFRSPRRPHAGAELRLFHTSEDGAPVSIAIVSGDGRRVDLDVERRGGPPYGFVARWPRAEAGTHVVLVGRGADVRACETIVVEPGRAPFLRPVSSARNVWDRHTEALYAVFVEKLFDYPLDDRTWPSLDVLLADRERNVLFDHFTAGEEARLRLAPDCADLPVFLRAYFAWKLGLPFGFRSCSRGGEGQPPRCGPLESNLTYVGEALNPITDFLDYVNGPVRGAVHSASGRTLPDDEHSDFYPVALERGPLRPGTVYVDPYGHVMTIVRFVPRSDASYGMLVAADAQPDATIGRPRFWRGTFLFTPDARTVGAGFKAFRPVFRRGETARALSNAELERTREFVPFSRMQYAGSLDDFYDRVESVIDPEPLDPEAKLVALVDALEDTVARRLVSVDNAQGFLAANPGVVIPMPRGAEIFLTTGPWEDYSTPSRDLRLLIALDAVTGFPARVGRDPARFRVAPADVDATVTRLEAKLAEVLAARRVTYRGSGGVARTLTLADVRARARDLEVAYNPNDCPEIRWAAPVGSEERAACTRRAPEAQRQQMERTRRWFATRTRPTT